MKIAEDVIYWIQSLGWCDPGYELTPMITEVFNTTSHVPGIILALIGFINAVHQRFEYRFKILHIFSVVVDIGSLLLHCSLEIKQQHTDEIPMVWIMLVYIYALYSPDFPCQKLLKASLILYGIGFALVHSNYHFVLGFQLHYLFLAMVCAPGMVKYYLLTTDSLALRLAHQYLLCFSYAITIWIIDQRFCKRQSTLPVTPQWHALFHVLNGLNNYFGNMFLQYSRAKQLELDPQLRYVGGMLPYVKVIWKNRRTIAIQAEADIRNKVE